MMPSPIATLITTLMLATLSLCTQAQAVAETKPGTAGADAQPAAAEPSRNGTAKVQAGSAVTGNAERGRLIFASCRTCHYPEKAVGHNNGPSLWNIFNLEVGSQPGFDYSPALRNAEFVWTPELLDLWLQDTSKFLPGNMMMSPGETDPQRRADLIEYLKQVSTPEGAR